MKSPVPGAPATSGVDHLVADVGLDLLGDQLGADVEAAVNIALQGGAVFPGGKEPLLIFRNTLRSSICDIEADKRGRGLLIQRFLRDGPYERDGEIPPELQGKRLTTEETAKAITFIYAFMVNSFKGAVTELLAAGACQRLLERLRKEGRVPQEACLFVGDAVLVSRKSGRGYLKGATCIFWQLTVLGVTARRSGFSVLSRSSQDVSLPVRWDGNSNSTSPGRLRGWALRGRRFPGVESICARAGNDASCGSPCSLATGLFRGHFASCQTRRVGS